MSEITCPELNAISPSRAEAIRTTFIPMADMVEQFEERFTAITLAAEAGISKDLCAKAKRLRLDVAKIRIETEKTRKAEKEEYLRAGKAIDGIANVLKWAVEEKEGKLKAIEDHFENIEKDRLQALQLARQEELARYIDDDDARDLSSMPDDVWEAYLEIKKRRYEDRIAAEAKAKADAEAKEKAEAEERERIRQENIRLKAEREQAAKEEAVRKAKEEAERKAIEEQHRKEREAAEAKARAEKEAADKAHREELARLAKIKAEDDAKRQAEEKRLRLIREKEEKRLAEERRQKEEELRIEREKNEAIVRELLAKEEAEREAKEAALTASDKDKIAALIADLEGIKGRYEFKSAANKSKFSRVKVSIDRIIEGVK